ncbi:uncharacterized protein MICPUCDRAFT_58422 [Micromonas pusilla CCMP1545]|uniref:Predicted protein n=1 Tax=Micromonas pusilla (strain CCMP1545) TaxID=564608 RepID=C1MSB5_MICPC|nr:uncharacterized protein MICPUCDRAFT_58422 [Micromonas pusilla CCMP1545]EEH57478.1 predicted protein [Micromonas pusilla CCMP1545]|eukprot:XP_003059023.1 predicted protein [Micromonas pusilla CCMP1545]
MPLASSAAPPTTSSLLAPTPPSTRRRVVVVRRPRPRSSPRTTTTTTRAHWNVARTGTRAHSRAPHQISIALPRPISDHLGFAPEHLPAPHRYPELEARRRGFAPLFLGRLERFFFLVLSFASVRARSRVSRFLARRPCSPAEFQRTGVATGAVVERVVPHPPGVAGGLIEPGDVLLWIEDQTRTPPRKFGAFYTLVPIRPRPRGERRSLRTLPVVSLCSSLAFNPRPRRLSTPLLTPLNSTPTSLCMERPLVEEDSFEKILEWTRESVGPDGRRGSMTLRFVRYPIDDIVRGEFLASHPDAPGHEEGVSGLYR